MSEAVAAAIAGGLINSAGQLYANYQNLKANDDRFGAEVELANTAHRREVQDLIAAGLNPILSASGSGAAVPQLSSGTVGNVSEQLGNQVSSAGRLAALDIPLKESQVELNSAQAENLRNDGVLKRVQAEMISRGDQGVNSAVGTLREGTESLGSAIGKWFAEKFGPQPVQPSPTRRSVEDSLRKDDLQYNKHVEYYRRSALPNRHRSKRR